MSKKKKKGFLNKLGRSIYAVVDTIFVTPLSKLYYKFNRFLNKRTASLDGLLNEPKYLIIFSLVVAYGVFLLVNSQAINLVETESEILSNEPVTVIYNEEKYVVEGVPKTVDIILMGRKSDLYLAKQLGDHEIVLDLSDYKTGEYNVKLKYNHSVESVTYKLDPGTVNVKISEKVSAIKSLSYDLINLDKLSNKLNVSEVTINENEVYIKGSSKMLDKVAAVKALVDVSSITEAGTFDLDKLPLVAYDQSGKLVENVEIVPNTASAKVKVESYYLDLPVKVVPEGNLATGYAIRSASSNVTNVRVYGDQSVVSKLTSISAVIDVEGLNSDKTFNITLTKPNGVREMSENSATITVKVDYETTKEIEGISIEAINLSSSLTASTVNKEDTTCTVIMKGVSSILETIKPTSIKAIVDLNGLGVGVHDVPVKVEGQDLTVQYTPKVTTVQIRITN